ncbi:hypothetical protein N0V85_005774 [Neurospora sp. IMI 360204]|nr:hypothetical protein N0V85_005774 [Neurospora sp. IMI 360204]
MERMDRCKVIRFPRRIVLDENEHLEFTARQVVLIRQFLDHNHANLSQLLTTLATDEKKSMDVFLARAYNATIANQQREILSKYQRHPTFTFSDLEWDCGPSCQLRVIARDNASRSGFVTGCASHDIVEYYMDEDPYCHYGYPIMLSCARYVLNFGYRAKDVTDTVQEKMNEVIERLDEHLRVFPTPESYSEKFVALDIQYKILHCLLTENNPIKQEIKAKREYWERLEACFMEVFERVDKGDLHRLAVEDYGIWCEMFNFVCHWADKEHILPRLSEARRIIAGAS